MRQRFFGLFFLLGLLITGLPATVRAANTFTDPQGRFTFTIPDGLTVDDRYTGQQASGIEIGVVLTPTTPADPQTLGNNVNVTIQSLGGMTASVDDAGPTILNNLQQAIPSATPDGVGFQSLTVGGMPAQRYGYVATINGLAVHGSQVAVIAGNNIYFMTFTATDDTFADFIAQTNGLLTSFMFLNNPATT